LAEPEFEPETELDPILFIESELKPEAKLDLVSLTESELVPEEALDPMPLPLVLVILSSNELSSNQSFMLIVLEEYDPFQVVLTKMSYMQWGSAAVHSHAQYSVQLLCSRFFLISHFCTRG